jgi:hypothetical protein
MVTATNVKSVPPTSDLPKSFSICAPALVPKLPHSAMFNRKVKSV